VFGVLDGDLHEFIQAYLKHRASSGRRVATALDLPAEI
jgi:hypothetical protein